MSMRRHRAHDYTTARQRGVPTRANPLRDVEFSPSHSPPPRPQRGTSEVGVDGDRRLLGRLNGRRPSLVSPPARETRPRNRPYGDWMEACSLALEHLGKDIRGKLKTGIEVEEARRRYNISLPGAFWPLSGFTSLLHPQSLFDGEPDTDRHLRTLGIIENEEPLRMGLLGYFHYELQQLYIPLTVAMGDPGYARVPSIRDVNYTEDPLMQWSPAALAAAGYSVDVLNYELYRHCRKSEEVYYRDTIRNKVFDERRHTDRALIRSEHSRDADSKRQDTFFPKKMIALRRRTENALVALENAKRPYIDSVGLPTQRDARALRVAYQELRLAKVRKEDDSVTRQLQIRIDRLTAVINSRMALDNAKELAFLIAHDRETEFAASVLRNRLSFELGYDPEPDPTDLGPWPFLSTPDDRHPSQVFVGCVYSLVRFGVTYAAVAAISASAAAVAGIPTETVAAAAGTMSLRNFVLSGGVHALDGFHGHPGRHQMVPLYRVFEDIERQDRFGAAVIFAVAAVLYHAFMFQAPLLQDEPRLKKISMFVGGAEGHMGPQDDMVADFVLSTLQLFLGPRITTVLGMIWVNPTAVVDARAPLVAPGASPGVGRPMAPAVRRPGNSHRGGAAHPKNSHGHHGEAAQLKDHQVHSDGNSHRGGAAHPKNSHGHHGEAAQLKDRQVHSDGNSHRGGAAHPKNSHGHHGEAAHQKHRGPTPTARGGGLSHKALIAFFEDTPLGTADRCTTALISAAGLDDPRRKDGQAMNVVSIAEAVAAEMTPAVLIKAVERMMAT